MRVYNHPSPPAAILALNAVPEIGHPENQAYQQQDGLTRLFPESWFCCLNSSCFLLQLLGPVLILIQVFDTSILTLQ